jgi:hypothetical protein
MRFFSPLSFCPLLLCVKAQRESITLFQVMYFKTRHVIEEAIIYNMKQNGFLVFVPKYQSIIITIIIGSSFLFTFWLILFAFFYFNFLVFIPDICSKGLCIWKISKATYWYLRMHCLCLPKCTLHLSKSRTSHSIRGSLVFILILYFSLFCVYGFFE